MDVDAELSHKHPLWHRDEDAFMIEQIQPMLTMESLQQKSIPKSGWCAAD